MKKLMNTLFVTSPDAYIGKQGDALLIKQKKQKPQRIPLLNLDSIVCFGKAGISAYAMNACARENIPISLISPWGRFLARVHGPASGNVLVRREQFRRADDLAQATELARSTVGAKLTNTRVVLLRASRETADSARAEALADVAAYCKRALEDCLKASSLETLRGIEGDCARRYFSVFNAMIKMPGEDFLYIRRSRRPPTDRINALLSFAYSLLTHECSSALQSLGLDPAVGYLHGDRPGRLSLALDLVEEFRAWWADRLVLALINREELKAGDFIESESGAVLLTDAGRKTFFNAWRRRKEEIITHPVLEEKVSIGLLPYTQALLLSRHLRGDIDYYPPFIGR